MRSFNKFRIAIVHLVCLFPGGGGGGGGGGSGGAGAGAGGGAGGGGGSGGGKGEEVSAITAVSRCLFEGLAKHSLVIYITLIWHLSPLL